MTTATFKTTREGIDHGLRPMRLFAKAKTLGTWDPAAIDLAQDAADWRTLSDPEQDLLLRLSAQFGAGEESVTTDLLPLLGWAAAQGRLEDELFLTSYLWEEAKHVEAFDRFLREVARFEGDLEAYLTPAYRAHFADAQPAAMDRLRGDHSTEALVDALVTYQMGTEGILAETGYHAYYTVLQERGILPGMQQIVQLIQRDESRHVGYGIYLLSRLIAEHGDAVWDQVEARLAEVLMGAMQVVAEMLAPYGDDVPFGLSVDPFLAFAQGQFQKRHARLEKARTTPLDVILYGSRAPVGGDGR
ncbi:R2-like ligand-binding oxidase [Rubrivirga sp.]|uniref:R2-like ligand-binding oxidase n=1 Tax=Rubrivirga sp. TaxID=1885344 RepID=UPI003B522AB8